MCDGNPLELENGLDALARKHYAGFTFNKLIHGPEVVELATKRRPGAFQHAYRERRALADAYDYVQAFRGSPKRVVRV